jgi:hypothetical protein
MPLQPQGTSGTLIEVDPYNQAQRFAHAARGPLYTLSAQTGTMAAALAANSSVFAMRLDPAAGASYKAYIVYFYVTVNVIAAFTTTVTAGRRLALFRGTGGPHTGATQLTPAKFDSVDPASEFAVASGGDCRIATTAALAGAPTFEADPLFTWALTAFGVAGANANYMMGEGRSEVVINQGETLAVRNPAAMDAAGTWQLTVNAGWYEGAI